MIPKRILVADDDPSHREVITRFAKLKGYDVVVVADGVDLLKTSTTERFDLIITDLFMPDLDGAAATEIMKLQGNTVPVIALTALSSKEIDLVQYTFAKIFHKPCDFNELFEYVESLIGK
jgi:two-component system capsular synthesis sensor histidine kinase RcsC